MDARSRRRHPYAPAPGSVVTPEYAILNEIARSVGVLTERIDGIRVDVSESRQESKENRERVYLRLEQSERKIEEANDIILARVANLEKLVADNTAKITEIEPITKAFTRMQQRGAGALAVIGLAATIIGGAVALKWDAFTDWINSLWG